MRKANKLSIKIGDKTYYFNKKTNLESYKDICYLVYTETQGNNKELYKYLMRLSKILFPDIPLPFNDNENITDRDYLDICIEAYQALYFFSAGRMKDYTNLSDMERLKVFENDKLMNLLLSYKMEKYGQEIFNGLGMEIVRKVEDGYIIRDLDQDNKPVN